MIEYENKPVGIIQYQLINKENNKLYNLNIDKGYGIDIFIGELELHNKGIGKMAINLLSKYLYNKKNANILVMCPLKDNYNAIKCYNNCGFIVKNTFKTKDTIGDINEYVLMIKEK